MKLSMMILAATLMGSAAMAAPQDVTNATVRFNTNMPKPVPSFALIPAVSIGSSSFSQYDLKSLNPTNTSLSASTSYEAGILAEFGRGTFVFQTGLMYISDSYKSDSKSQNSDGLIGRSVETGSFNYLGIPLALKARARVSEGIRLSGRFGVMPAVLTSAKLDYTDTVTSETGTLLDTRSGSSTADNAAVRSGQVFVIAGGGPEFRINRTQNVRVEAMYERMLLNMATSDAQLTMQSIGAMISYGVGF